MLPDFTHYTDISKESRQNLNVCLVVFNSISPWPIQLKQHCIRFSNRPIHVYYHCRNHSGVSFSTTLAPKFCVHQSAQFRCFWTTWLHDWTSAQKLHRSFPNSDIFVQQQMTAESVSSLGYRGRWFVMTDPMLTGNPAIVTIEGSLRIIDLYEKVFYSCISRLLVLWDFLLKTIGLIKKNRQK